MVSRKLFRSLTTMVAVLSILVLASLTFTQLASAQDSDEKKVTKIEIRDGKVFVDGEEIDLDEDQRFIVSGDNGIRSFMFNRDGDHGDFRIRSFPGGNALWFGDEDDENEFIHRDHDGNVQAFEFSTPHGEFELLNPMMNRLRLHSDGLAGELRSTMENNMAFNSMEREAQELAMRARRAEGEEREELEDQLREKLDEIFDAKLRRQQEQVERITKQLSELSEQVDERSMSRDQIVDRRFRELMGERNVLDW